MSETEILTAVGVMIGAFVSPLYGILLWRMKKSDTMDTKITKLCTFIKLKFPESEKIFNSS